MNLPNSTKRVVSKPNKLIERGKKTRREILNRSVDIASAEGLEGLTIGRLAKELEMSKSGLFAHFGSKEDLQVATVGAASGIFVKEVSNRIDENEDGLAKLLALLDSWGSYVERSVFRGGCFFFAVSAEMDDRPGKVRDLIAKLTNSWIFALEGEIKHAIEQKELRESCDIKLLVFQLHGFVQEANWFFRLHEDEEAFNKARKSILQSIGFWATKKGKTILDKITGNRESDK